MLLFIDNLSDDQTTEYAMGGVYSTQERRKMYTDISRTTEGKETTLTI